MSCQRIDIWSVFARGFTQREGDHTGMEKFYYRFREQFPSLSHEKLLNSWRDDVEDLANRIYNHSTDRPWVNLIGYSYGGQTVVNLCWALAARGIRVGWLFLIDAVYRAKWVWQWWRSLTPWQSIKVPPTVENFMGWYQKTNLPSGHRVILPETTTNHGFVEIKNVKHEWIDDQHEIHRQIMDKIAA